MILMSLWSELPLGRESKRAATWEHRELTHKIHRTTKELVRRQRPLHYLNAVRNLQKQDTHRAVLCVSVVWANQGYCCVF